MSNSNNEALCNKAAKPALSLVKTYRKHYIKFI